MMNRGINRRTFLKRVGQTGGLLAAGGSIEYLLAACGGNIAAPPTPQPGAVKIPSKGLLTPGLFQWGSTSDGGAPYVFQDPTNPNKLVGFEFEIADAIASLMGIREKQAEN